MEKKGLKRSQYVVEEKDADDNPYCVPKSLESFGKVITGMIRAFGIKNGKATRNPKTGKKSAAKEKKKNLERLRKARKESKVKVRSENSVSMDVWLDRTVDELCEKTERRFCEDPDNAQPGEIFIRDRRETSGYVSIYCKPPKGRPIALCLIQYRPKHKLMDFKWPVAPDEFNGIKKEAIKELDIQEHRDGAFMAISKGLSSARLAMATEVLLELIKQDTIELPA